MPFQNILKTDSSCNHDYRYEHIPYRFRSESPYTEMPLALHSDGSVCWFVTDYLIERCLSIEHAVKQSSLLDEARSLSRFIQFLDSRETPILFTDCTDKTLFDYVEYLLDPKNSRNPPQNNQINKLVIRVLKLFLWHKKKGFIAENVISDSEEFANINLSYGEFTLYESGAKRTRSMICHEALLNYQDYVPRKPITEPVINKLHDAVYSFTLNLFIQDRWQTILEVLEQTGVRVSELTSLSINSVHESYHALRNQKTGRLTVTTTKGANSGKKRVIPVPEHTIELLYNFMVNTRNPIVEEKIDNGELSHEHKKVFINDNGTPMTPKNVSRHFSDVKKNAKINEPASPHLFRHRYITKQVKTRLELFLEKTGNYNLAFDSFITKKVMVLTGHARHDSLLGYVDFAMEEMGLLNDIELKLIEDNDNLSLWREISAILSRKELRGAPPSSKLKELISIVHAQMNS